MTYLRSQGPFLVEPGAESRSHGPQSKPLTITLHCFFKWGGKGWRHKLPSWEMGGKCPENGCPLPSSSEESVWGIQKILLLMLLPLEKQLAVCQVCWVWGSTPVKVIGHLLIHSIPGFWGKAKCSLSYPPQGITGFSEVVLHPHIKPLHHSSPTSAA